MQRRFDTPVRIIARDGVEIVLVPLVNWDGYARLLPEDWEKVVRLGVSVQWGCFGKSEKERVHGGPRSIGTPIVARLIMDAGPEHHVRYLDGNRLNLRRQNLWLRTVTPGPYERRARQTFWPQEFAAYKERTLRWTSERLVRAEELKAHRASYVEGN